jgi:hypothetical protein
MSKKYKHTKHSRTKRPTGSPKRMQIVTGHGYKAIDVKSRRSAILLARYTSAVGHFLKTGDTDRLAEFKGLRIEGKLLITDPEVLTELALAGEMELDELYVHPGPSR